MNLQVFGENKGMARAYNECARLARDYAELPKSQSETFLTLAEQLQRIADQYTAQLRSEKFDQYL